VPLARIWDHHPAMATNRKPAGARAHDILAAEEFGVPARDPALHHEDPHDILAAEGFEMPAPDPALHREDPHDVLAAEEFGVPAPDPALHHGPVTLPGDPTGIAEPHDILAAEEFAMPAATPRVLGWSSPARALDRGSPSRLAVVALGALVLALVRRRRSSRRR
jgi:hypothetical protein